MHKNKNFCCIFFDLCYYVLVYRGAMFISNHFHMHGIAENDERNHRRKGYFLPEISFGTAYNMCRTVTGRWSAIAVFDVIGALPVAFFYF